MNEVDPMDWMDDEVADILTEDDHAILTLHFSPSGGYRVRLAAPSLRDKPVTGVGQLPSQAITDLRRRWEDTGDDELILKEACTRLEELLDRLTELFTEDLMDIINQGGIDAK